MEWVDHHPAVDDTPSLVRGLTRFAGRALTVVMPPGIASTASLPRKDTRRR
jgi:hypothetical protein